MILTSTAEQELKINGYANTCCDFLATDSYDKCYNKKFFKSFPHKINYKFNSLGYREYSIVEYQHNPVVIIGDSAITGVGLPFDLTVAKQLEKLCNQQVLNFSMCGASNDWIARKLKSILKYFEPQAIIIHYTFSHRRELPNTDWTDDERTLCNPLTSDKENYQNWKDNHDMINCMVKEIPICYSFIPNWHTVDIDYRGMLPPIVPIDVARDFYHYGEKTTHNLAKSFYDHVFTILLDS
jgi:hypothetical protein